MSPALRDCLGTLRAPPAKTARRGGGLCTARCEGQPSAGAKQLSGFWFFFFFYSDLHWKLYSPKIDLERGGGGDHQKNPQNSKKNPPKKPNHYSLSN